MPIGEPTVDSAATSVPDCSPLGMAASAAGAVVAVGAGAVVAVGCGAAVGGTGVAVGSVPPQATRTPPTTIPPISNTVAMVDLMNNLRSFIADTSVSHHLR